MNLGLATAKRRAQDRSAWRKLVATLRRPPRHAAGEREVVNINPLTPIVVIWVQL